MPDSPPPSNDQTAEIQPDSEEWEDEEDMIAIDDILDLAEETNGLIHALMGFSPELKDTYTGEIPKPLSFVLDFVRKTYMDFILPLLPTDAQYKAREIANSFLFEYTTEKPLPTDPNPGFLDDEANWPNINDELYTDAVGRNMMICLAILEAHEAESRGAVMLGGRYDFDLQVKEAATMIMGGLEVQEEIMRSHGFLGVPFAQPPVDNLRWLPPVTFPSNQSKQIVDATQFSLICPQYASTAPNLYNTIVLQYFPTGPSSEDCLTLSIYTPERIEKPLPVFIWLHGGGLQTGGSNVPYQIPAQWVQRTQSHIVVGLQYRLNIFGFPNSAGLSSQNLGYLDQRMGMAWVRSNIAAFGGDPEKMILWGQSAGATSTDTQNFAFPDDPIVKGFISDSGSAFQTTSKDFAHTNFTFVAKQFNCSTGEAVSELECMRSVSSNAIEAFLMSYQDSGIAPTISFEPVVDNVVIFENYTQQILDGKVSDKPSIFGTNDLDGTAFAPFPVNFTTTGVNITISEEIEDSLFLCGTVQDSVLRNQTGLTTYRFQYRGNFTNVSPIFWMGAYHSAELPQIFGTEGNFRGPATSFEVATSHKMQDLWLAFAEDPENGLKKNGWTDFSAGALAAFGGGNRTIELVDVGEVDDGACGFMGLDITD